MPGRSGAGDVVIDKADKVPALSVCILAGAVSSSTEE